MDAKADVDNCTPNYFISDISKLNLNLLSNSKPPATNLASSASHYYLN